MTIETETGSSQQRTLSASHATRPEYLVDHTAWGRLVSTGQGLTSGFEFSKTQRTYRIAARSRVGEEGEPVDIVLPNTGNSLITFCF